MNIKDQINHEIVRILELTKTSKIEDSEDFNIRGELYRLALDLAPKARDQDIEYMREWLRVSKNEIGIDIAAGTGFLTHHLAEWSQSRVYAIDPSEIQLGALKRRCPENRVVTVHGDLSKAATYRYCKEIVGTVDYVTSYGGIHHVTDKNGVDRQHEMFKNVSQLLKSGGRFIAGDVGAGTALALHFEKSVKKHCLTGHDEKWLSPERLHGELLKDTDMEFVRAEIVPIVWNFSGLNEMALFMKALHAYNLTEAEIISDLGSILGFHIAEDGCISLNWPMLLFELRKK